MTTRAGSLSINVEMELASIKRDIAAINAELKRGTDQWSSTIEEFGAGLKSALGIGAIAATVTAGIAAVGTAVRDTLTDLNQIADASERLGMTAEDYQLLVAAFRGVGKTAEDANGAMERMLTTVGKAAGGSKAAAAALKGVNVEIEDLQNMTPAEQFRAFVDSLSKIGNQSERQAKGVAIFGNAYNDMSGIVEAGIQGLDDSADAAYRMAQIFGDEAVQATKDFNANVGLLTQAGKVLISDFLGPILRALANFTDQSSEAKNKTDNMRVALLSLRVVLHMMGQNFRMTVVALGGFIRLLATMPQAAAVALASVKEIVNGFAQARAAFTWGGDTSAAAGFLDAGIKNAKAYVAGFASTVGDIVTSTIAEMKTFDSGEALAKPAAAFTSIAEEAEKATKKVKEAKKEIFEPKGDFEWFDKYIDGLEKAREGWARQADAARDMENPIRAVREEMKKLEDARKENIVTEDDYRDIFKRNQKDMRDAIEETTRRADDEWAKATETLRTYMDLAFDVGEAFAESSQEGIEALKKLTAQLLITIAKAIMLELIMRALGQGSGKSWGDIISGALTGGKAAPASAPITFGPTTLGMSATSVGSGGASVGSIPISMGSVGKRGGGGSSNVVVNNYGAKVDTRQDGDTLTIYIEAARAAVAGDIASGGNNVSAAMERTYGVRR